LNEPPFPEMAFLKKKKRKRKENLNDSIGEGTTL